MLERMDEVGWGTLEHAYGPAHDVPGTIRALVSPDADVREKALHHLYGTIFHQGTRYEATAYAVPFLLELLGDPRTPGRPELARLVALLAVGYDERWLPRTFPVALYRERAVGGEELLRAAPPLVEEWAEDIVDDDPDGDGGEDDDEEGEEDRYSWYESLSDDDASAVYAHVELAAYDAVRAGVPLFRSLLVADDPVLRTEAAYALAWFPEDAAGSVAALVGAGAGAGVGVDVSSPTATATALVALGLLGEAGGIEPGDLEAALAEGPELVRWGAAVALVCLRGADAGSDAVTELLGWAGGPAGGRDDQPFLRGDIGGVAVLALRRLDGAHAEAAYDALLRRLGAVSGMPAVTVLHEALVRAWPDGELPPGTPFGALTPPQQRLLEVLDGSPGTWRLGDHPGLFGNFTSLLAQYALPRTPDELHDFVDTT